MAAPVVRVLAEKRSPTFDFSQSIYAKALFLRDFPA